MRELTAPESAAVPRSVVSLTEILSNSSNYRSIWPMALTVRNSSGLHLGRCVPSLSATPNVSNDQSGKHLCTSAQVQVGASKPPMSRRTGDDHL